MKYISKKVATFRQEDTLQPLFSLELSNWWFHRYPHTLNNRQVTAVHEVMHTMKTNLANIKNVLAAWDRPLMERKPKPVDRDEFERAHKAIKSSRYAEIKEGGKVKLEYTYAYSVFVCQSGKPRRLHTVESPPP